MSTILKALRQLEKEESDADERAALPGDGGQPVMPPMPRRRRWRGRLWLGVGLGIAGLSLITVALLPRDEGATPVASVAPGQVAEPTLPTPADRDFEVPAPGIELASATGQEPPVVVESPAELPVQVAIEPPIQVESPVDVGSQFEHGGEIEVSSPVEIAALDGAPPVESPIGGDPSVALDDVLAIESAAGVDSPTDFVPPVELTRAVAAVPTRSNPPPRATPNSRVVLSNDDLAGSGTADFERARAVVQARPTALQTPESTLALEPVVARAPVPEPELARGVVEVQPTVKSEPQPEPRSKSEPAVVATAKPVAKPQPVVMRRAVAGAKPPSRYSERSTEPIADAPVEPAPLAVVALAAPELGLNRTRWHPQPERREATLLEGGSERVVREGDAVLDYTVVEITPSSIVFGKAGATVRVPVGAR